MLDNKGHPNRLGIWGWLGGGRWGLERYLYTLHRLTGLGLLFYFLLHILVTSARAFGADAWAASMARVTGGVFVVGEFLVFMAFAFHAANGVRLVLVELGWGIGNPIEPVYPYRDVGARTAAAGPRRDGAGRPHRPGGRPGLLHPALRSGPCAINDSGRGTCWPAGHPRVPRAAHGDHAPRRAGRHLQSRRSPPIAWANVVARAKMGFFTVSYVVLLGAALFHGLYGLRNILFELGPGRSVKSALNFVLTAGGVGSSCSAPGPRGRPASWRGPCRRAEERP